jgi:hypothetical protein
MHETPFLFYEEFVVYVPTRKMSILLDTYNMYIEDIEEASFCEHTM